MLFEYLVKILIQLKIMSKESSKLYPLLIFVEASLFGLIIVSFIYPDFVDTTVKMKSGAAMAVGFVYALVGVIPAMIFNFFIKTLYSKYVVNAVHIAGEQVKKINDTIDKAKFDKRKNELLSRLEEFKRLKEAGINPTKIDSQIEEIRFELENLINENSLD